MHARACGRLGVLSFTDLRSQQVQSLQLQLQSESAVRSCGDHVSAAMTLSRKTAVSSPSALDVNSTAGQVCSEQCSAPWDEHIVTNQQSIGQAAGGSIDDLHLAVLSVTAISLVAWVLTALEVMGAHHLLHAL